MIVQAIKLFELSFCQNGNGGKHKSISIETKKNKSKKVVDLLIYKEHYVLTEKNAGIFR